MVISLTRILSFPTSITAEIMGFYSDTSKVESIPQKKQNQKVEEVIYDFFAEKVISDSVDSVIFLDIDGVVFKNLMDGSILKKAQELFPEEQERYSRSQYDIAATHLFNQRALSNLEKIFFKKNIAIVLSSSWREYQTVSKIRTVFSVCFFAVNIIDKTVDDNDISFKTERKPLLKGFSGRGAQIEDWLRRHPTVKNYVIIDDNDDGLSENFAEHFVQTDEAHLLTEGDAEKSRKILELFRNPSN